MILDRAISALQQNPPMGPETHGRRTSGSTTGIVAVPKALGAGMPSSLCQTTDPQ